MPASVQLVGQSFAVALVDRDDPVLGGTAIADGLAPDQERDTFLHEVLHALIRVINLIPKQQDEERVVVALAPLLLDALRRNPAMVKYLVAA